MKKEIRKKRLIFVRHGQTHENIAGILHVHTTDEAGLNEKGQAQINRLLPVLKKNNVTKVFTSPERRAVESAEIITAALGLTRPILLGELTERQWGEWQGKPWEEIEKKLVQLSIHERYTIVPPGGESWEQMEKRLKRALAGIVTDESESVAIVTHAGTIRALLPVLKNAPKQISFLYDFHNASVTIFDYLQEKFKEVIVNDFRHLHEPLQSCVFCRIAQKKSPAHTIWENEKFMSFLSIFPNTKGFSVVIPKQHYSSYMFGLPDAVLQEFVLAVKSVAQLLENKLDDVGRTAVIFEGFGVDHAHAKLFPMHKTLGMKNWDKPKPKITKFFKTYEGYISSHSSFRADDKELEALAEKLRS